MATALLKGHGEVVIPLGAHVDPKFRFIHDAEAESAPTVGRVITSTELDIAVDRLRSSCVDLNAELNELYRVGTMGCWLVRLTPRSVEEIMEVRVAVVGNVDAGKSTTLGVLTRGALDDGRGKVSGGRPN